MKKLTVILLCTVLVLSLCGAAIFGTSAEILQKIGIMKGTENGLEIERNVTRAEALVLIYRVCGVVQVDRACAWKDELFTDIVGHWAEGIIMDAHQKGYVSGISATEFAPERTVTGREFVKMLLTVLGYEGITIENAYDKGIELSLLLHKDTKAAVQADAVLTRGAVATICHSALLVKTPEGKLVKQMLVEKGLYTEEDFAPMTCGGVPPAPMHFADKLHAQMPRGENYMFSPLSIKMAFALAANGAQDETQREILDALGIEDLESFNAYAKETIAKYNAAVSMDFSVANAVWVNTTRTEGKLIAGPYAKLASEYFDAQTATVTDKNAVETINAWVKEKTNGKIQGLAENSEFYAFIANAVYFKAGWMNTFPTVLTKKDGFYNADGTVTETDFMQQTDSFNYGEQSGVRIIELPYKNDVPILNENGEYTGRAVDKNVSVSMYILLGNGNVYNPQAILESAQLGYTRVRLTMPKFETEFKTDLAQIMQALGVNLAFNPFAAQMHGIVEGEPLYIDAATHKTYIKVDEEGTEAAAVTGLAAGGATAMPAEPLELKIDKPFTYIIRDDISGEILFVGAFAQAQ